MPRGSKTLPKASKSGAAPKATMERDFSAGGVVVRRVGSRSKTGEWEVAIIEPRRQDDGDSGKQVLALPKGWVDEGERPEAPACREVREEAGLGCEVVTKLGDI